MQRAFGNSKRDFSMHIPRSAVFLPKFKLPAGLRRAAQSPLSGDMRFGFTRQLVYFGTSRAIYFRSPTVAVHKDLQRR